MTEQKEKGGSRFCPYCDEEIVESDSSSCKPCGVSVFYCPQCRKPLSRENRTCPHCGTKIRGEAT